MSVQMTVGTKLRELRKQRGETIAMVAKNTQTSPASFSAWENDKTTPSSSSLRKLARYYEVDDSSLLQLLSGNAGQDVAENVAVQTPQTTVLTKNSKGNRVVAVEELMDQDTVLTLGGKVIPDEIVTLTKTFFNGASAMYELTNKR